MTCNEIVPRNNQYMLPNNTVAQAATLMDISGQELLPICGPGELPLGVITAHDIVMRVLARGRVPALTRLDEVMSTPPLFVFSSAPVDLACEIMGDEGVSRLLVLDAAGRVEGIVSLAEILLNASDDIALATARRLSSARPASARVTRTDVAGSDSSDERSNETDQRVTNSARVEAELVLRGGTNQLKEFP